jgi:hypothetical protein
MMHGDSSIYRRLIRRNNDPESACDLVELHCHYYTYIYANLL